MVTEEKAPTGRSKTNSYHPLYFPSLGWLVIPRCQTKRKGKVRETNVCWSPTTWQSLEISHFMNLHTHPLGKVYYPYLAKEENENEGSEKWPCVRLQQERDIASSYLALSWGLGNLDFSLPPFSFLFSSDHLYFLPTLHKFLFIPSTRATTVSKTNTMPDLPEV